MLAKGTAEVSGYFPNVDTIIERAGKAMEDANAHCIRQAQSAADTAADRDAKTIGGTSLAVVHAMGSLATKGAPHLL